MYSKHVTLLCDNCSHNTGYTAYSSATEARIEMDGWTYRDGNDYCPDCDPQ